VARARNQLGLVGENNRAARLRAAARQCAPSTLPSASSVSAGGRQKRRNTLLLGTVGSLINSDLSIHECRRALSVPGKSVAGRRRRA